MPLNAILGSSILFTISCNRTGKPILLTIACKLLEEGFPLIEVEPTSGGVLSANIDYLDIAYVEGR